MKRESRDFCAKVTGLFFDTRKILLRALEFSAEYGVDGVLHHDALIELLLHLIPGGATHLLPFLPAQKSHLLHLFIEAVGILELAQQSADALVHRLSTAVDIGSDDGTACGGGL